MKRETSWEHFSRLNTEDKAQFFNTHSKKIAHNIYAQQFSQAQLEKLFKIADTIRVKARTKEGADFLKTLLSDKRAMLFFAQPSTRTFLSFQNACHILGMSTSDVRDTSTSSEAKGESFDDTIRTFSSYVDLIVMRHADEGLAERAAWMLSEKTNRPVPVINGGSGKDQHPTQALLDIYSLKRHFDNYDGLEGKRIVMAGDLRRGRTVRSLCRLLSLYKGVSISFAAPEEYKMRSDILEALQEQNITFTETDNFVQTLEGADAVYMTRIQNEHDQKDGTKSAETPAFHLKPEHLSLLPEHAFIMHPLPRRDEIHPDIDNDPKAGYWKQARNGMCVRAALILEALGREGLVE